VSAATDREIERFRKMAEGGCQVLEMIRTARDADEITMEAILKVATSAHMDVGAADADAVDGSTARLPGRLRYFADSLSDDGHGGTGAGFTASRKNPGRPRGYIDDYKPQAATIHLLREVQQVLTEYHEYLPLTVRQIFYRLVGKFGYEKTENAYHRLCEHVSKARRARLIPFDYIRDDGVAVMRDECYADADAFRDHVRREANAYRRDMQARQPYRIEVWCEAAGMQPQLANAVSAWSIPVYSSGGFDSLTSKYDIVQRVIAEHGRPTVILHLGDCDPAGETMFRAAAEDVAAFVEVDRWSPQSAAIFKRVALTEDQVESYNLPTAPAKASSHAREWGDRPTAQLEALPPDLLNAVVQEAVVALLDQRILGEDEEAEEQERFELTRLLPAPREEA
jgi:hypothetical protein